MKQLNGPKNYNAGETGPPSSSGLNLHSLHREARSTRLQQILAEQRRCWFHGNASCWESRS
jgi:hypothetical protein